MTKIQIKARAVRIGDKVLDAEGKWLTVELKCRGFIEYATIHGRSMSSVMFSFRNMPDFSQVAANAILEVERPAS